MEVVGGVASVVQLVQAAAVLSSAAWKACQRLHDAPNELQALADHLVLVHEELQRIHSASDEGHALLLTVEIRRQIEAALLDARKSVDGLNSITVCVKDSRSLTSRVRWVLKDCKLAAKVLARLQRARERLAFLMDIVQLYVAAALRTVTSLC